MHMCIPRNFRWRPSTISWYDEINSWVVHSSGMWPLNMKPLGCLVILGTNHSMTWYHISDACRHPMHRCDTDYGCKICHSFLSLSDIQHTFTIILTVSKELSQNCKKKKNATISFFFMSVCPSACNKPAPTRRISIKFDVWIFFETLSRKIKFH